MIQTNKTKPLPVILFDSEYWEEFLAWLKKFVLTRKFISEEDLNLLRVCDHPDEIVNIVQNWSTKQEIIGNKALYK